eukprot:7840688-Pyramimonas_sp.AAC.1
MARLQLPSCPTARTSCPSQPWEPPLHLGSALSAEHPSWLRGSTAKMRRPPAAAAALRSELGLHRPYVDPAFRHRRVYADFVQGALGRGMVRL